MNTLEQLAAEIDEYKSHITEMLIKSGGVKYSLSNPFDVMAARLLEKHHSIVSHSYEDPEKGLGFLIWNGEKEVNHV